MPPIPTSELLLMFKKLNPFAQKRLTGKWAVPLALFIVAKILLWSAAVAAGFAPLDARSWIRWDSNQYLGLAESGYWFSPCDYDPSVFCGNTAWLPGYPWLIRGMHFFGIPSGTAGVLLSNGFILFSLLLLWNLFLQAEARSWPLLAMAAMFPGHIYHHALFPLSCFLFLALLFLHAVRKERWREAALWGFLAAFTYVTGVLLAGVVILSGWVLWRSTKVLSWGRAGTAAITGGGLLMVLLIQQLTVGSWKAFFVIQSKYSHGFHNPFQTYLNNIRPLWELATQKKPRVVALRSRDGRLLTASEGGDGPLIGYTTMIGDWEKFVITSVGEKQVALEGYRGQYWSVSDSGDVWVQSTDIRKRSIFALTRIDGDRVALRGVNGGYVGFEEPGGVLLVARKPEVGSLEAFEMVELPQDTRLRTVRAAQSLWVGVFVVLTLGSFIKRRPTPIQGVLLAYTLVYWIGPHIIATTGHSFYRAESLLLPAVVLAKDLPRWVLFLFFTTAIWLSWEMAPHFFSSLLV
ncbi:MAG: hypothetical protein HY645_03765 [Acidobacteria bacterium]|nr:hypothetical protein [Acidobacteriota bacterium]